MGKGRYEILERDEGKGRYELKELDIGKGRYGLKESDGKGKLWVKWKIRKRSQKRIFFLKIRKTFSKL